MQCKVIYESNIHLLGYGYTKTNISLSVSA